MKDRFKAARKALDMSQDEFAESLGLTRGAITNIELGKVEPKDKLIALACKIHGVDEKWLRTGEGEMFAPQTQEEELASVVGKLLRADNPEWYKRQLILAISDMKAETILDAIEQIKKRFADQ